MKIITGVLLISFFVLACSVSVGKRSQQKAGVFLSAEDSLRLLYSLSPDKWPAPFIDSSVRWQELGIVPESPLKPYLDSLQGQILLGKTLFFDQRLSGSNQIACASCHLPELSW
ncbi:MAG: cytochrome-c peroxidase, partial [Chitinophagaceae bacterium]